MGINLYHGLAALGCTNAFPLRQFYPELRTPDEVWIPDLASRGYFVVTRDINLWDKRKLQRMLLGANAGSFVFDLNNMTRWKLAQAVIRQWAWMENIAAELERPFAFAISPSGFHRRLVPEVSTVREQPLKRRHRE